MRSKFPGDSREERDDKYSAEPRCKVSYKSASMSHRGLNLLVFVCTRILFTYSGRFSVFVDLLAYGVSKLKICSEGMCCVENQRTGVWVH